MIFTTRSWIVLWFLFLMIWLQRWPFWTPKVLSASVNDSVIHYWVFYCRGKKSNVGYFVDPYLPICRLCKKKNVKIKSRQRGFTVRLFQQNLISLANDPMAISILYLCHAPFFLRFAVEMRVKPLLSSPVPLRSFTFSVPLSNIQAPRKGKIAFALLHNLRNKIECVYMHFFLQWKKK